MSVFDLEGRKALVTGGAKGLGAGMAEALAKAGASVMIGDVLEDEGRATAEAVGSGGVKTGFVKLDVTDDANWEEAVAATAETLGGFDILVNNAGIEISSLVVDLDPNDIRRMCEVNILGTALGTKHGLRSMRPGGVAGTGGSVINISSVAATIPFPGISGYSATKSAVDRFTRVAAAESGKLGYGVRVNCIYPGLVATEMGLGLAADMEKLGLWPSAEAAVGDVIGLTPLGRLGEVNDMADAVVFLSSDAARFITGIGPTGRRWHGHVTRPSFVRTPFSRLRKVPRTCPKRSPSSFTASPGTPAVWCVNTCASSTSRSSQPAATPLASKRSSTRSLVWTPSITRSSRSSTPSRRSPNCSPVHRLSVIWSARSSSSAAPSSRPR